MSAETLLSVLIGVGLSAACGFRVFMPLLVMSIAAFSGHLTLSPGFQWIATYPALLAFAIATASEIAGYYIPWVDHFLDIIATPAAVVAGIIAVASTVTGMSPFLRWALAIIAGGGLAGTIQAITSITRLTSSATTGGLGNPVVSTIEAGSSVALSVVAVAIPLAAAFAVPLCILLFLGFGRKMHRSLRSPRPM
jgi:hypothetical protein